MTDSIYLVTRDFEKSLDFYKKLLQKDPDGNPIEITGGMGDDD